VWPVWVCAHRRKAWGGGDDNVTATMYGEKNKGGWEKKLLSKCGARGLVIAGDGSRLAALRLTQSPGSSSPFTFATR
jgi:hypothetical protein